MVDIRNLKFYVEHGLIVKKVSKVISFRQSTWMKPYIEFNTEMRKKAKNDFEKDFYKLMCNSCFGKTMENVRNRVSMSFVTSNSVWGDHAVKLDRAVERKIAGPLYDGHMIYNEDGGGAFVCERRLQEGDATTLHYAHEPTEIRCPDGSRWRGGRSATSTKQ